MAVLSRLFTFTYLSCHIKRKYAQTKVTNTTEQYDHGVSLITTEEIRATYAFIQVIFSSLGSCQSQFAIEQSSQVSGIYLGNPEILRPLVLY